MKCNRCDWTGEDDAAVEHARETGHTRCVVCRRRSLTEFETQTCEGCTQRVRDDLDAIAAEIADLDRRLRDGAYSGGWLLPLAMLTNGSTCGGGEDDHVNYHDPVPIAALLELHDRDWRETFGHGKPSYKPIGHPDRQVREVLSECLTYLRTWLTLAARTHPAFDDFATEVADLRSLVEHVALLALDPKRQPIPCACGGRLEQHFDEHGLSDNRVCRVCGMTYKPNDYWWRYRMLTEMPGWVSVERAAEETERSKETIWAWVYSMDPPSACNRLTRRTVVELAAVVERSARTPRQQRRRAG